MAKIYRHPKFKSKSSALSIRQADSRRRYDKANAISLLRGVIRMVENDEVDAVLIGCMRSPSASLDSKSSDEQHDNGIWVNTSTGVYGRLYKAEACAQFLVRYVQGKYEDGN